jgi:ABC-type transport system involved in multi-copper enzyme maturation permease subunit
MTATTVAPPTTPPATGAAAKVTQLRVINSEWIKLRSLRSTVWTLLAAMLILVGIGMLFSYIFATHYAGMPPERRASFDPVRAPLNGFFLAQLAVGVLGVLVITGEYSTGMIRATLGAVPTRLPVLWAKALVFGLVTLVLMVIASFLAFFGGQLMLSTHHLQTTISAPGAVRVVVGTALYLTVVGLLGLAIGAILRNTAGGIATLFGLLLVLPVISDLLPTSWSNDISPYLPSNAGQDLLVRHQAANTLAPWTGFGLFCLYAVVGLIVAAILLRRRDA